MSVAHEVGEYVRGQINRNHPQVSEVFIHIGIAAYGEEEYVQSTTLHVLTACLLVS